MKLVRVIIDKLYEIKYLKKFKPVLNATDAFFFGTDRTTASAPHILDNLDIKRYMSTVIIALIPPTVASIYFYGWRSVAIILVSYIFGGLTEVIFAIVRKKEIEEGLLVTGLIFPLILPPTVPLWVVAVGIVFGVILFEITNRFVFGKENTENSDLNYYKHLGCSQIRTGVWFCDHLTAAEFDAE